ncbi:MAG: hypothetical protein U0790_28760 [Isosphaeraceae bacterium]
MALVSGPTLADAIADPANEITGLVAREGSDEKLINELFVRVLNRPATPEEIATCKGDMESIDNDHRRLAEALGRREVEHALKRPQLERERLAAIAAAQKALADYQKELAPRLAEKEKEKAAKSARLEADLKAYESGIPAKLEAWEKAQAGSVVNRWAILEPKSLKASGGVKLAKEADGSVVVSGDNKPTVVTIVAETDLSGITGVRLEALPDPRNPNNGPGRAPDGNFVLAEIQLSAAPRAAAEQAKAIALQNPLADFSQVGFEVAKAADGNPNDVGSGWAVSPVTGVTHWATFETKEPVGQAGGSILTFQLHQRFAGNVFQLGRFRLSVTRQPKPGLSLPENLRAVLATAPEVRSQAQKDLLLGYFRAMDNDLRQKIAAVNASKAPLPVDPKLASLKGQLEQLQRPVPVDPVLVQLRHDLEMSIQQAAARRLTAAQDIAWALINSPAFLFNH